MYFALYHFEVPLYGTGCRMFAFTEDLKDLHLEKPALRGSALQHAQQHLSTTQGFQASLSLELAKISAPPPKEEGLHRIPR